MKLLSAFIGIILTFSGVAFALNLPWTIAVNETGFGTNEISARAVTQSNCDRKVGSYRPRCVQEGGHFSASHCIVSVCNKLGFNYNCQARGTAYCRP